MLRIVMFVALAWHISASWGAAPQCEAPEFRQFDFWVGRWQVTTTSGEVAGANRITAEQNGCVLVERWQGSKGGTGVSLNFFSPEADEWRQVWVSPGAVIDIAGGLVDESMILAGSISYTDDTGRRDFRGTWTPLADGSVRQYFEERIEGDWRPWFEGFYARSDLDNSE